ncbi:MAG: DUF5752 family protein [Candidatus Altiarchaeota archaeon]
MKRGLVPTKIKVLEEFLDGHSLQTRLPKTLYGALVLPQPSTEVLAYGLGFIALIALVRELKNHNKPVRVLGVTRTDDGRLRVDVENRSKKTFYAKPSIRVAHFPSKDEVSQLNEIPMLAASSNNPGKVYDLVGEAADASVLMPGEVKQIMIDEGCPGGDELSRVCVSLEYGAGGEELSERLSMDVAVRTPKDHPYLRQVGKARAFLLKDDHAHILGEACMLEGLVAALDGAPVDAIRFHMRDGNDFAGWVRDVVGDEKLAGILSEIALKDPEETRRLLLTAMRHRVMELEDEDFSGRHPNLNQVGDAYAFKLKADHTTLLEEARFLKELRDAIRAAPPEAIVYHLYDGGNDFADWSQNVLGDEQLAGSLRSIELISPAKTREVLAQVIESRIKELEIK